MNNNNDYSLNNIAQFSKQDYYVQPPNDEEAASTTLAGKLRSIIHESQSGSSSADNLDIEAGLLNDAATTPEAFDFNARQAAIDNARSEDAKAKDRSIFWRIAENDLDPENPEAPNTPRDLEIVIKDGEARFHVSTRKLRPVKKSQLVQNAVLAAVVAAAAISNAKYGQGIVTKGLVSAAASSLLPKFLRLPGLPPFLGPVLWSVGTWVAQTALNGATTVVNATANATGAIFANSTLNSTLVNSTLIAKDGILQLGNGMFYLSFASLTGLGLCALLYKRAGKALATGGWPSFKPYVIPFECSCNGSQSLGDRACKCLTCNRQETGEDLYKTVSEIELKPLNASSINATVPVKLRFSVFNNDMYYSLVIGEKEFDRVRMASKDDDDDDDDDEDFETQTKKEKTNAQFPGEGITTTFAEDGLKEDFETQTQQEGIDAHLLGEGVTTHFAGEERIFSDASKIQLEAAGGNKEKEENTADVETVKIAKSSTEEKAVKKKKKKKKKAKAAQAKSEETPACAENGEEVQKGCFQSVKDWLLTPERQIIIKEGILFGGSGVATIVSKYFLGEGLTTSFINTIFSASAKAKIRLQPLANGYGMLALASGTLMLVKVLSPVDSAGAFVGELVFMPLSIIVNKANKDIKDMVITGKEAKNVEIFQMPLVLQKLRHKLTGWTPEPFVHEKLAYADVLENKNDKTVITFKANEIDPNNPDLMLKALIKIDGRKLTGVYKQFSKEELTDLLESKRQEMSEEAIASLEAQIVQAISRNERQTIRKVGEGIKKFVKNFSKVIYDAPTSEELNVLLETLDAHKKEISSAIETMQYAPGQEKLRVTLERTLKVTESIEKLQVEAQEIEHEFVDLLSDAPDEDRTSLLVQKKTSAIKKTMSTLQKSLDELSTQAKILIKTARLSMSEEEQSELSLATLKGEKLSKVWEYAFIVSGVVSTLFASWATKQYQLSSVAGQTRIQAEKLGEGVFTSMLNSVLGTFMKQTGKNIPDWTRRYGFFAASVAAIALERELLNRGVAPFLFSGIVTSSFLAMISKEAKAFVFNREYGKSKGKITTQWPTDEHLATATNKIKALAEKIVCCMKKEGEEEVKEQELKSLVESEIPDVVLELSDNMERMETSRSEEADRLL